MCQTTTTKKLINTVFAITHKLTIDIASSSLTNKLTVTMTSADFPHQICINKSIKVHACSSLGRVKSETCAGLSTEYRSTKYGLISQTRAKPV